VWIAFSDIQIFAYSRVTIRTAGGEDSAEGFTLRLDSENGDVVAAISVGNTGGWEVWQEISADFQLSPVGVHDIYLVATTPDIGNGNLDWVRLHN
jgi:hypothetical protein